MTPDIEGLAAFDDAPWSPDTPPAVWGASLERGGLYAQAATYWAQAAESALTDRQRHWCESRQAWCERRAERECIRARRGFTAQAAHQQEAPAPGEG
ncbi:TPA: ANR family transcriptional regulator [Serratia liquefaciens]